jgi:hypothetical protein
MNPNDIDVLMLHDTFSKYNERITPEEWKKSGEKLFMDRIEESIRYIIPYGKPVELTQLVIADIGYRFGFVGVMVTDVPQKFVVFATKEGSYFSTPTAYQIKENEEINKEGLKKIAEDTVWKEMHDRIKEMIYNNVQPMLKSKLTNKGKELIDLYDNL